MRTFRATATVSFNVQATFTLTKDEFKRAELKYGDLDAFAQNELNGEDYEAQIENGSAFTFRDVSEITINNEED